MFQGKSGVPQSTPGETLSVIPTLFLDHESLVTVILRLIPTFTVSFTEITALPRHKDLELAVKTFMEPLLFYFWCFLRWVRQDGHI